MILHQLNNLNHNDNSDIKKQEVAARGGVPKGNITSEP